MPLNMDESIEQVIETYKSTVYGIALTRTKSRHDADDIFQEIFLAYCRKHPQFNGEEHRRAWLIRATSNYTKKFLNRKRYDAVALTEDLGAPVFALQSEEESAVYTTLCELPEAYRTVLYLYYFEDLSVEEIGKCLKVRPKIVRARMTQGQAWIREKLEGDYFHE